MAKQQTIIKTTKIERMNIARRLAERLGEYAVLTLEQQTTLQRLQHEIASRMTNDVPAVDKMQLYDLLHVQCVYDSETNELLISGLFGEATVHDIDKQSRIEYHWDAGTGNPPRERMTMTREEVRLTSLAACAG